MISLVIVSNFNSCCICSRLALALIQNRFHSKKHLFKSFFSLTRPIQPKNCSLPFRLPILSLRVLTKSRAPFITRFRRANCSVLSRCHATCFCKAILSLVVRWSCDSNSQVRFWRFSISFFCASCLDRYVAAISFVVRRYSLVRLRTAGASCSRIRREKSSSSDVGSVLLEFTFWRRGDGDGSEPNDWVSIVTILLLFDDETFFSVGIVSCGIVSKSYGRCNSCELVVVVVRQSLSLSTVWGLTTESAVDVFCGER
mmetsp:Transcript_5743/g.7204  ORF Transcript_5743/g.7204 Transcript_5743/m.7204 type:complete len:256 (-) Transcript_5743:46-813(-)